MQSLRRLLPCLSTTTTITSRRLLSGGARGGGGGGRKPPKSAAGGEEDWDDAWETAWLPDDLAATQRAPWEFDVHCVPAPASEDMDEDTKAFVAEMDERWGERRAAKKVSLRQQQEEEEAAAAAKGVGVNGSSERRVVGDDYRIKKQRIHAGLWVREIEKLEESKLGGGDAGDDIDRLLDSCAEIFDSGNMDINDSNIPSTSELKTKPDGWETTSKTQDGNIWNLTQREEDILLQEFERRIAFSKFQIASFIKTHIFSRRRPIDGWKYMIEELGPNAKKGKGSVQRMPSLADPSTQPFKEEKMQAIGPNLTSYRSR